MQVSGNTIRKASASEIIAQKELIFDLIGDSMPANQSLSFSVTAGDVSIPNPDGIEYHLGVSFSGYAGQNTSNVYSYSMNETASAMGLFVIL